MFLPSLIINRSIMINNESRRAEYSFKMLSRIAGYQRHASVNKHQEVSVDLTSILPLTRKYKQERSPTPQVDHNSNLILIKEITQQMLTLILHERNVGEVWLREGLKK